MHLPRRWSAFACCLLLAIVHTWPLALDPGTYSRNDNADTQLNEWIMAWVAHQLPRNPAGLFEANIFYPAHDVLAFSEPLILPAVLGAPLAWAGASPVLVYNLVLLAGFALSAFATCLVVERWTGSLAGGLVAGSLFAFNTHTLHRLPHMQALHLYGLPIALYALDWLARTPSLRAALLLSAALAAMAYTSGYLFVFACVMTAVVVAVRWRDWWPVKVQAAGALALAAVVTGLAILPVYLPYRRVAAEQHMVRSLASVAEYSATPWSYLSTTSRLHAWWGAGLVRDAVDSFFPGVVALALAGVAIGFALRARSAEDLLLGRRSWMLVAIAIAGAVLSLGTLTPIYGVAFTIFPPMQGLRAAARFANLYLMAIAILAGFGAARVGRPWLAAVLVVAVNAESLHAPMKFTPFRGVPEVYSMLATEPGPVVLVEQPFFPRWAIFQNGGYVLASTAHWRPLMNGYSGYTPESYQQYADTFWYFPEPRAIDAMKQAGVTHVMVHTERFHQDRQAVLPILEKRGDFALMGIGPNGVRLYRLLR
jgi:hypothetical protein